MLERLNPPLLVGFVDDKAMVLLLDNCEVVMRLQHLDSKTSRF